MAKLSGYMYRWTRIARDIEVLSSGDPDKILRRAKNKYIVGRLMRGPFRWIWR